MSISVSSPCIIRVSPMGMLSYSEYETDYSIRSSEHLIISEIHLRKSILITFYGMVDVLHTLFMHPAISY